MPAAAATLVLLALLSAPTRQSRLDESRHNFFGPGHPSPDPAMDGVKTIYQPPNP